MTEIGDQHILDRIHELIENEQSLRRGLRGSGSAEDDRECIAPPVA